MKFQTFDGKTYKTEAALRNALEGQMAPLNHNTLAGNVEMTFGDVIRQYFGWWFAQTQTLHSGNEQQHDRQAYRAAVERQPPLAGHS
jgi:hypothetical protein